MTNKITEALRLAEEALVEYRDNQYIKAPRKAIAAIREVLAEQEKQEPVAWCDHVEHRLLTWRQSFVNRSGDQLALDDFMDQRSLEDLIDFVCDEYTAPTPRKPEPVEHEPVAVISESAIGLVKLHSNGVGLPFGTQLYAAPVSAEAIREGAEMNKTTEALKLSLPALENAESVAASINAGKRHAIQVDEETCFWQREEWVRWAIDEVLPEIRQALAAIREALADHIADAGKVIAKPVQEHESREDIAAKEMFEGFSKAWAAPVKQEPVAWGLAEKVRRDLDRQSCPGVYMNIAVESIVKNYTTPVVSVEAAVLAEREACAKVCEEVNTANKGFPLNAKTYAAAIRARSEK